MCVVDGVRLKCVSFCFSRVCMCVCFLFDSFCSCVLHSCFVFVLCLHVDVSIFCVRVCVIPLVCMLVCAILFSEYNLCVCAIYVFFSFCVCM